MYMHVHTIKELSKLKSVLNHLGAALYQQYVHSHKFNEKNMLYGQK